MNAERRKAISEVISRISALHDDIESVQADLQSIASEEEEARENMAAQSGPNYEMSEEASEYMDECDGYLDDALSTLDEIFNTLENIVG